MLPNTVVPQITHKPNILHHSSLKTIKASVGRFYKTKNDKYTLHPLNTFRKTQRKKPHCMTFVILTLKIYRVFFISFLFMNLLPSTLPGNYDSRGLMLF